MQSVTKVTPKLTIPSPSNMHFRGGRAAIDQKAYPDMAEFYADLARVYSEEVRDLAAAGCRYLQIDEVYIAYLCDPALREQVAALGENPQTLPRTYVAMINGAVAGRPKDMTICMHLCRGNNQSGWVASGGYEPVAEVLFNEADVTGYFLEYDSERAGGFEPLRFVPKGRRWCWASSPARRAGWRARTRSSGGSTKRRSSARSISSRSARSADFHRRSKATS